MPEPSYQRIKQERRYKGFREYFKKPETKRELATTLGLTVDQYIDDSQLTPEDRADIEEFYTNATMDFSVSGLIPDRKHEWFHYVAMMQADKKDRIIVRDDAVASDPIRRPSFIDVAREGYTSTDILLEELHPFLFFLPESQGTALPVVLLEDERRKQYAKKLRSFVDNPRAISGKAKFLLDPAVKGNIPEMLEGGVQPDVEDRIKEFEKIVLFYILRFVSDRNDDEAADKIIDAFTSLTPATRDPVYYQAVKDVFGGGLQADPYLLAKKVLEQIRHVPQQSSRE